MLLPTPLGTAGGHLGNTNEIWTPADNELGKFSDLKLFHSIQFQILSVHCPVPDLDAQFHIIYLGGITSYCPVPNLGNLLSSSQISETRKFIHAPILLSIGFGGMCTLEC